MDKYLELKGRIDEVITKFHEELCAFSDDLADNPEVANEEFETSRKIVELLRREGFEVEYPFAGFDTAFKAVIGEDNHKYKICILTEYDALPGIGHACAHNVSGAISILSALALKELQDELDADIHVIGTPAEEADGAKPQMANNGVFNGYDFAMMVHLYDQNLVWTKLNCLASWIFNFHGEASHAGAMPWGGRNALNAAQLMMHGIDCIRGCCHPDTRLNSVVHLGGYAAGSIPSEAQVETWIRHPEYPYLEKLLKRVENCVEGGALMAECTWDGYETAPLYKSMKRNETGENAIAEVFGELGLEINGDHEKLFGSSDAGNVSWECPAFHPCLQLTERGVSIHTEEFLACVKGERAYKAILQGAQMIAYTAAKIFTDEEKIKQLKADFEAEVTA
ncbi:MAG: M20 family metallopeptidase [Firmicutes bacterium]|nr:M20 family metallopeptidase [Bacillota bacterium]